MFQKYLPIKISVLNQTRWDSSFKSLEDILSIRSEIVKLYDKKPKELNKYLIRIQNDVKYLLNECSLYVYPLLYPFHILTNRLTLKDYL